MDAHDFDWKLFEEEFLQWHYASLPDDQPQENILLFGEDSDQETSPKKTDSKISRTPSKRSNVSSPASETGDSSSKKTSSAYIKRRCQNRAAQRAFRARQKDHMGALEQKLQGMLAEYDNLQQKYTSLSIAYDALVNEKGAQENRDGSSYMSMLSDGGWNFTDAGCLEKEKHRELEEERSRFLSGSFRYR